jgi:para-nitrobenzyl esterase
MQSLKEGLSSEIPIIIGTNRDENKLFLVNNPRHVRTIIGLPRSRDRVLYDAIAKHRSNTWKYLAVDNPSRELILSGRSNIFAYRFDWDDEPRRLGVDISHLLGAAHAFEIPFVMGNLDKDTLTRYIVGRKNLDSVKQLSEAMMSYWAEFAYTGDPGMGRKGDLPLWEALE